MYVRPRIRRARNSATIKQVKLMLEYFKTSGCLMMSMDCGNFVIMLKQFPRTKLLFRVCHINDPSSTKNLNDSKLRHDQAPIPVLYPYVMHKIFSLMARHLMEIDKP